MKANMTNLSENERYVIARTQLQQWNPVMVHKVIGEDFDKAINSFIFTETLDRAQAIHGSRTRSNGDPYMTHIFCVRDNTAAIIANGIMGGFNFNDYRKIIDYQYLGLALSAATGHDNIEDAGSPQASLAERKALDKISPLLGTIIDLLSRRKGETYYQFIHRLADPFRSGYDWKPNCSKEVLEIILLIARIVKAADLQDNLKDGEEGSRADKYRFALDIVDPHCTMRRMLSITAGLKTQRLARPTLTGSGSIVRAD